MAVTRRYGRLQNMVTVDDNILSKMGIPLAKINTKCVRDFVKRQEALAGANFTPQPSMLSRKAHIATEVLPDAPQLPELAKHPHHPQVTYTATESLAGTRAVKLKQDHPRQSSGSVAVTTPSSSHPIHRPDVASSSHPIPRPNVASSSHPIPRPDVAPSLLYTPARSTYYKNIKRVRDQLQRSQPILKKAKVTVPLCGLCGGSTQGHSKYKKSHGVL